MLLQYLEPSGTKLRIVGRWTAAAEQNGCACRRQDEAPSRQVHAVSCLVRPNTKARITPITPIDHAGIANADSTILARKPGRV